LIESCLSESIIQVLNL